MPGALSMLNEILRIGSRASISPSSVCCRCSFERLVRSRPLHYSPILLKSSPNSRQPRKDSKDGSDGPSKEGNDVDETVALHAESKKNELKKIFPTPSASKEPEHAINGDNTKVLHTAEPSDASNVDQKKKVPNKNTPKRSGSKESETEINGFDIRIPESGENSDERIDSKRTVFGRRKRKGRRHNVTIRKFVISEASQEKFDAWIAELEAKRLIVRKIIQHEGHRSKRRREGPSSGPRRQPKFENAAAIRAYAKMKSVREGMKGQDIEGAMHKGDSELGQSFEAAQVALEVIEKERGEVPRLAHGLSRALFNQGVYQFRDLHSRVYNFDPSLEMIPPVDRVDFKSLSQFTPPSKDRSLAQTAKETGKKFIGSTSSMTGLLKHFHFLLSRFRGLNFKFLSLLNDNSWTFSKLTKGPDAVILRYDDGVYSIDADKEFDSANVLSLIGRYLEKYFTTERSIFERFKTGNQHLLTEEDVATDSYHYSSVGDFILRSQLDAYDPRLPGTGIFDLKTRAVLPIRMDSEDFEWGMDYEIRTLQGKLASYEREFADMARSTMLKYSLQARIGRMDGIFVAYHNIARIFGFQYISINEMDLVLHGTEDRTLGDHEFLSSMKLLNELMNKAVERFPEQSLRIHCETPETKLGNTIYLYVEPVDQVEIDTIQNSNKAEIEKFERELLGLGEDGVSRNEGQDDESSTSFDPHEEAAQFRARARKLQDDRLQHRSQAAADADLDEEVESTQPVSDVLAMPTGAASPDSTTEESTRPSADIGIGNLGVEFSEQAEALAETKTSDANVDIHGGSDTVASEAALTPRATGDLMSPADGTFSPSDNGSSMTASNTASPSTISFLSPSVKKEKKKRATTKSEEPEPTKPLLVLTLRVASRMNGRPVLQPEYSAPSDVWEIRYDIDEIAEPKRAWSLYQACKKRRKAGLGDRKRREPETKDFFIDQLKQASESGKEWRGKLDERDRAKEEAEKGVWVWDRESVVEKGQYKAV